MNIHLSSFRKCLHYSEYFQHYIKNMKSVKILNNVILLKSIVVFKYENMAVEL